MLTVSASKVVAWCRQCSHIRDGRWFVRRIASAYETVALPAELLRRGSGRLHPLASDSSSL